MDFRELADGGGVLLGGPAGGCAVRVPRCQHGRDPGAARFGSLAADVTLSIVGIERWTTVLDGLAIRVR